MRPEFEDIGMKNRVTTAKLVWQPRGYDPHLAKWLHRIDVPTLLVWGGNDRVYPRELGDAYAKLIPDAKLVVVPECGHLPQIERREAFVAALHQFLDRERAAA